MRPPKELVQAVVAVLHGLTYRVVRLAVLVVVAVGEAMLATQGKPGNQAALAILD